LDNHIWFKEYFTPENKALLDLVKKVRFGSVNIKIHQGKITEIQPTQNLRFHDPENTVHSFKIIDAMGEGKK